ncbi:MAG: PSD1 domain-containing protein [Planctomycetaceae bacterium]|nr:PSD1 domain-containing protein [Planctomycetaceae bacterium]
MARVLWLLTCLCCVVGSATSFAQAQAVAIDFGKQILPILQRSCIECHGPDKQEGNLRLDTRAATVQGGDSGAAIVPGKPNSSELLRRVALSRDHAEVMPARGEPLSAAQVRLLRDWIAAGATWPDGVRAAKHWSYVKPTRPELPAVKNATWSQHPLDRFVLARLEREGLAPSPPAEHAILVRRLYLDLIGLPPTPEQVDHWVARLNDSSATRDSAALSSQLSAFDRQLTALVDSLLASDQFGVRWARPWLDYARYADSHGFQRDDFRELWPYRDWVVDALNADMPFDQFTIEQLAGDLLPDATESQRIATGFNRNAPTNVEAGSDPEETRVNQVFDRVNTLGMIWLGSSLECAQCHDHKYDPFTMRDYYGLFAFFNHTELEADRSNPKVPGSIRFLGPEMKLESPEIAAQSQAVRQRLNEVTRQIADRRAKLADTLDEWEASLQPTKSGAAHEHVLAASDFDSLEGATHEILADQSILLSGEAPDRDTYTITVPTKLAGIRAIKLETLTHDSLPGKGPGRGDATRPNFVLNRFALTVQRESGQQPQPVKFVSAKADFAQKNFDPAGAIDENATTAWAINPEFHEPHWAVFELAEPLDCQAGATLMFTLEQNFGAARTIGRLRLSAVTGGAMGSPLPSNVATVLAMSRDKRSAAQRDVLIDYRLQADPEHAHWLKEKSRLEAELKQLQPPTTLVMRELDEPRASTTFMRGDFRAPGEPVPPLTPAALYPLRVGHAGRVPNDGRPTRLDLARWLVDRENPLVARVTVNRWWAELFGQGIVTTPEDFGIKGELPTQPELLDWLAVEFMEHGWSMKHVLRTIVTSATYRQSSRVTPELLQRDDRNLLLTRGPRCRLEAELIRDNALAIAGLLNTKRGGAPIRPYQPDGLWVKVGGQKYDYVVSAADEKYRRGLYVVWKRAAPYPSFVNFDANSRLACRVKRPSSNTPLQALTLMNDPVYVEIAKAFALQVATHQQLTTVDERLRQAFRSAVARAPQERELATLRTLYESQLASANAQELKRFIGDTKLQPSVSPPEFAAWYAVCTAILNLDETITKN